MYNPVLYLLIPFYFLINISNKTMCGLIPITTNPIYYLTSTLFQYCNPKYHNNLLYIV